MRHDTTSSPEEQNLAAAALPQATSTSSSAAVVCEAPNWMRFLYNHNPFYLISTFLVLYGIRIAYGDVPTGQLNCWLMMVTLTAYTLLVATTGIFIVRLGSVWDDARSIILSLCLLFVAISVTADELVMLAPQSAMGLMLYGFFLSVGVSQAVISGTGMRFPWGYLLPFYAMLFLIDTYAYVCSPEVQELTTTQMGWRVFLFPQLFALLLLTLWPAIRRGPEHVGKNGTPWNWPLYPGALFVFLFLMAAFRAYILSLSFGPYSHSDYSVVFDGYFLIPMSLAGAFLILEGGLTRKGCTTPYWVLGFLPSLLILAHPTGTSRDCQGFYQDFSGRFGTPLWLTGWGLALLYAWGTYRRVSGAYFGLSCSLALLSLLRPHTTTLAGLESAAAWGLATLTVLMFVPAIRWKSAEGYFLCLCLAGGTVHQFCVEMGLPHWAPTITFHGILLGVLLISLRREDEFADTLKVVGAVLLWYAGVAALPQNALFPGGTSGALAYFVLLTLIAAGYWRLTHSAFFLGVMSFNLLCLFASACWWGYAHGVGQVGRGVMFAISWAFASFTTALLISLLKAGRLRWLRRWCQQGCNQAFLWWPKTTAPVPLATETGQAPQTNSA